MNGQDICMLEEYVNGDDSIPVCMEFDSDRWDKKHLSHFGDDPCDQEDSEEQNESITDIEPTPLKIKTFQ